MAFNLYFAGSGNTKWEECLLEHNCNRLASQLNDKKVITDWLEYKKTGKASGKLFIDSGAFSAHTKNSEVDVDKYVTYLNEIDDLVDVFAQVDKIPGEFRKPKTLSQCIEAPKLSWENYLQMRDMVKSPDKLLYIFHQNESFEWLRKCLNATFNGKPIPYIGISPANDKSTKEKRKWFDTVFQIIRDSNNPNIKTHAFGMTSLKALETYPFYSADSTSWIMTGANGSIMTEFGIIPVSDKQLNNPEHIVHIQNEELVSYIEDFGFNIEELGTDYTERIKFNAVYLQDWANNYVLKGQPTYRKRLF